MNLDSVRVADLVANRILRLEDGNHGECRPRAHEFIDDGVPFIRAADMSTGVVDFEHAGKINNEARSRIRKGIGLPNDILLSHKGTVGKIAVAPASSPDFVCSPQTTFWRSLNRDLLDQRYLRFYMDSEPFQRQLRNLMGQTDMAPYVSLTDQRSLRLVVPEIAQQRAIAEVLGALDDKIAANVRVADKATELAWASFFRAAANGETRQLSAYTSLMTRGGAPSYVDRGLAVLNQKCIRHQRVSLDQARLTDPVKVRADRLLVKDDVLINSTGVGTLGRVARWVHETEATVDSHITIVRFNESLVDPVCAGFALLAQQPLIESMAEGSTGQTELRKSLLEGLVIGLPPLATQRRIGRSLSDLAELEAQKLTENAQLAETRDGLLPLLMSGRLRVTDAQKAIEGVV